MSGLRVAHRLAALGSIGSGLVVLYAAFTDRLTDYWPAVLIWIPSSIVIVSLYRRLRAAADKENPR